MFTYEHQQPRRRQQVYPYYAPNAASLRNPARLVVVVVAALGSETAEVPVTRNFVPLGTKAFWPAKEGTVEGIHLNNRILLIR